MQHPIDHAGRVIDFGRTAADYEQHRPGFPDCFFEMLIEREWVIGGQRVLDVGTGTGSIAFGLAELNLDVTGLDISPELLDGARRTARQRGLDVRFVEGTAEATGQDAASFDIVTAGQCWWWFDSQRAASEARRVLRRRGRLLICDFSYLPLDGNVSERTEQLILRHNPGWTKAGGTGIHPEQVGALDRGEFRSVESFSYIVDVTRRGAEGYVPATVSAPLSTTCRSRASIPTSPNFSHASSLANSQFPTGFSLRAA